MKNYGNENKESSHFKYWDVNNLRGCIMSQKLPLNEFKWLKKHVNLMKISQKAVMIIVMRDVFLKSMLNVLKMYITFTMIYSFA